MTLEETKTNRELWNLKIKELEKKDLISMVEILKLQAELGFTRNELKEAIITHNLEIKHE